LRRAVSLPDYRLTTAMLSRYNMATYAFCPSGEILTSPTKSSFVGSPSTSANSRAGFSSPAVEKVN